MSCFQISIVIREYVLILADSNGVTVMLAKFFRILRFQLFVSKPFQAMPF